MPMEEKQASKSSRRRRRRSFLEKKRWRFPRHSFSLLFLVSKALLPPLFTLNCYSRSPEMLLSRQCSHARGSRHASVSGSSNRGQSRNRAALRTPAPATRPSVRRRSSAAVAASTSATPTTPAVAAPSPPPPPTTTASPPPLLPTASPFDPSLERLRPARASNSQVLVREGFWEWENHRIRYIRAGFGDDSGGDVDEDGNVENKYKTSSFSSSSSSSSSSPPPKGPLLVCVHGFGGNADHWRKNVPGLAAGGCRVAAIDLLGYGYSSKPDPRRRGADDAPPQGGSGDGGGENPRPLLPPNRVYTMEAWARQLLAFIKGPCGGGPAFLITNSIGGIAALQAAVYAEEEVSSPSSSSSSSSDPRNKSIVAGVQLMDVSLRMLHSTKQPALARPLVSALQALLRETPAGELFFSAVAKPQTVSKILKEAYGDPSAVDDELVDAILKPGLEPGATQVFLDFISMSGGPLPETLLSRLEGTPVSILWGEKDPWEKLEWGRELAAQAAASKDLAREWRGGKGEGNSAVAAAEGSCVEEFEVLFGVGHCPQDEVPGLVNPLTLRFVRRHHK